MIPMLARTYGPKFSRWPVYVQPKLNGIRALYQSGTFQSRDEKLWKLPVLQHLVVELLTIAHITGGRILDGELYKHGWRLQKINGAIAVNRNEPGEGTKEVEYHVFDIVDPSRPFSERWVENSLRLQKLPHIKFVDTAIAHNVEQLNLQFHYHTSIGYEGIMLRLDGPYEFGQTPHGTTKRSEFLWKHKKWEDGEFRCVGITQGEGKADIGIGALTCICDKPNEACESNMFNVGTGFDDSERIEYMKNPPIGRLVKVRYLELTQDGIPFNPSFLALL